MTNPTSVDDLLKALAESDDPAEDDPATLIAKVTGKPAGRAAAAHALGLLDDPSAEAAAALVKQLGKERKTTNKVALGLGAVCHRRAVLGLRDRALRDRAPALRQCAHSSHFFEETPQF